MKKTLVLFAAALLTVAVSNFVFAEGPTATTGTPAPTGTTATTGATATTGK